MQENKDINKYANSNTEEVLEGVIKKWTSIAESGICALEVVCSQLPVMNTLLEDNIIKLGESFGVLAGHAQDQVEHIQDVVNMVSTIEIEGKKTSMQKELHALQDMLNVPDEEVDTKEIKKRVDHLTNNVDTQEKKINSALELAGRLSNKTLAAVTSAIISMQFQDRVAQNLIIAENVSKEVASYLKQSIKDTTAAVNEIEHKIFIDQGEILDKEFAKNLISYLTLGELQHKFIEHLLDNGYIKDISQLGLTTEESAKFSESGNVELF